MAITQTITGKSVEASYSSELETFPASIAPTSGTISTGYRKDKIIGVGTEFTNDFQKGDFIWLTTTNEVVEIIFVADNLNITLGKELDSDVSGVAYKVVKKSGFKKVSWLIDGNAEAVINGITYPASTSKTYGNDKPNSQGGGDKIPPVLVDSEANGNVVFLSGE